MKKENIKCSELIKSLADVITTCGDIEVNLSILTNNSSSLFHLNHNNIGVWDKNNDSKYYDICLEVGDVEKFKMLIK